MDEEDFAGYLGGNDIYTYDNYNRDYLESFKSIYTTANGETVVAFGQYGYD